MNLLENFDALMEQYNEAYTQATTPEQQDAVNTQFESLINAEEQATELLVQKAIEDEEKELAAAENAFNEEIIAQEKADAEAQAEDQEASNILENIGSFIEALTHTEESLLDNIKTIRKEFKERDLVTFGLSINADVKIQYTKKNNINNILITYL